MASEWTPTHPRLRIDLLGGFHLTRDGALLPEHEIGSRKARTLLKVLLVREGRLIPMDTLVEVLWGDGPPAQPEQNVATMVSRLRTVMGSERLVGGRGGYRFVSDEYVEVDLAEARRLTEEAEARLRRGEVALAVAAADRGGSLLARGRLLEGQPDAAWVEEARREAERLRHRSRRAAWTAHLSLDDPYAALADADAGIAEDPLDEEAYRAAMQALQRAGDLGQALARYEQLRRVLADELGVDPSPQTQAAHLALLRDEPLATPRPAGPSRPLASPGFVGRKHELQLLGDRWTQAVRGGGGCVLVLGEAGIGKTRLVHELAQLVVDTGGVVLEARCYEAERSLFLQPVAEALRSLVTTLPPDQVREVAGAWAGPLAQIVSEVGAVLRPIGYQPAAGELERRRLFEAVSGMLQRLSEKAPVLVFLDDLHLAGASTVEFLHFALGRLEFSAALVVATLRSDEAGEVVDQLGERSEVVELGPLPADAVRSLARAMGVDHSAGRVVQMTGGHTLFALEALRAVAERPPGDETLPLPASLRAAVTTRVRRAGRDVEELLRAAAVVGDVFDLEVVAELLGIPVEEAVRRAERALQAHLLLVDGSHYQFANALVREVLYETSPAPTRVVRHRRLVELFADRPESAAAHAAAAEDWEAAARNWLAAARKAAARFANRDAEGLLGRALQALALVDAPSSTAEAYALRGRVRLDLAAYAAAREDLVLALQLARSTGEEAVVASALECLGWAAYYTRDFAQAHAFVERALQEPAAAPTVHVLAGRVRHTLGDLTGAQAALHAVADRAEGAARATALSCLGSVVAHQDRYGEAIRMLDEAVEACRRAGALRAMLTARFFGGMARANAGDFGGALAWFDRLAQESEAHDAAYFRPRVANSLAWVWRELGDLARARDLAEEARERAEAMGAGSGQEEPLANAFLALAESALLAAEEAEAARWLGRVDAHLGEQVGYAWRFELRQRELWSRIDPGQAESLLVLARQRRSAKYEALALSALGRRDEALAVARAAGSEWLVARVGPVELGRAAVVRMAERLPEDLRSRFLTSGPLPTMIGR